MGKSKKPFIDKKNSSKYHLLYRSQRDVADSNDETVGAGTILWPAQSNNKETDQKVLLASTGSSGKDPEDATLSSWKQQLKSAGLVDDYDYEQHMKPITGTGTFFGSKQAEKGQTVAASARSQDVRDVVVQEVDRQLESIALNAECMDDDIAQALFGDFDADDFEELNDEFVLDAAQEPEDEDTAEGGFDFAAHVQMLMERAKLERSEDAAAGLSTVHEHGAADQEFFSNAKQAKHKYEHDDDDDDSGYFDSDMDGDEEGPKAVSKLSPAEEQALMDKFNETLAEYDSDDLGEGEDDDDVLGVLPLEGDKQVEAALDDFLAEKKDDIFMEGTREYMSEDQRKGGSGFSALVGTRMVPAKELDQQEYTEQSEPIESTLKSADQILHDPLEAPPAEEIFIDGKSYFSETMRNPWDCESILSTYSNLDNNPVTIDGGGRRRKNNKKKKNLITPIMDEEHKQRQQILLSDKTGLPLGVLPTRGGKDAAGADTYVSVNKGEARKKKETAEEKKQRKAAVKMERQMARMEKKLRKEAFANEFEKRANEVLQDDVGGKSVFRF